MTDSKSPDKLIANNVTIEGNVSFGQASGPELKILPSGLAVLNFQVPVDTREKQGDSYETVAVEWIRVTAWRQLAEHAAASLKKGDRVVVTGTLKRQDYTSQNGPGTTLVLVADSIGMSLRFGTAEYTKPVQNSNGAAQAPQPAQSASTFEAVIPPVQQAQPVPAGAGAPAYQAPATSADLF